MPADTVAQNRGAENPARQKRRSAVKAFKRDAILAAARSVFAREGLDGATLRAIAAEAGVAVGTVYLHYPAKEALYADMLAGSLSDLLKFLREAVAKAPADEQLVAGALAFYGFYKARPDELYLGLYLAQGLKPVGLTPELDRLLNGRLIQCYGVLGDAMRRLAPLDTETLRAETVSLATCITGALVLESTGRLKVLGDQGETVVKRQVDVLVKRLRAAA